MSGRWVQRFSHPGRIPYEVWERGVPRIKDQFTDIAVYIYGSIEDAKDGAAFGGSGFLAMVPHEGNKNLHSFYVVTNRHVVKDAHTPVIRINRNDGGEPERITTREEDWTPHSNGDDVSVLPIKVSREHLNFLAIKISDFVTTQTLIDEDIGIGDDTVMVGRFISHEGKQQNAPAVRFGNIAMMTGEKIAHPYGIEQESFLVETRSLPGYSGSAVLIYSPCAMNDMSSRRRGKKLPPLGTGAIFPPEETETLRSSLRPKGPYLLGIDFCHLQSKVPIATGVDNNGNDTAHPYGWFVRQNSGMAGVIPAWKIADILNCEEFMEKRRKETERNNRSSASISLDTAGPRRTQVTPKGLEIPVRAEEVFFDDLKKASRKITPDKK